MAITIKVNKRVEPRTPTFGDLTEGQWYLNSAGKVCIKADASYELDVLGENTIYAEDDEQVTPLENIKIEVS